MVHTFGNFEVLHNGTPLVFEREKAKELLALLIDRQGLSMTNGEIEAFLWEELHSPQYLPSIDLLQQYGVPFVAIGRIENDDIPQADNDQLGAASEMTRVLFQMGARRIAYLGGSGTYTVNADRLRGYLRGLAEFGVSADQSLIRTGIESDEQRTDALEAVLEQHPDCLLCCDDRIAFDLMRELRNRHIRVPEQLRLASLYDSELLAGTTPAISAVQFDAERLGSTACRMLLDVMAGKDIPLRQVQGYQVILRESTK